MLPFYYKRFATFWLDTDHQKTLSKAVCMYLSTETDMCVLCAFCICLFLCLCMYVCACLYVGISYARVYVCVASIYLCMCACRVVHSCTGDTCERNVFHGIYIQKKSQKLHDRCRRRAGSTMSPVRLRFSPLLFLSLH